MVEIDWMNAKGWLKDGERSLLFELASRLPGDALILNIGVEFGASLACLRAGNPTAHIIGVDLDTSKAVSNYECDLIQRDSHELVEIWIWPLELVFVDGDHGETGVLLDAKFAEFIPVGGHILFQDCWDWEDTRVVHRLCGGVNAAVDKWFAAKHEEFEELPSVDTTRVFRRVKEHEQPPRVADSGGVDTDIRAAGSNATGGRFNTRQPKVSGESQNINRG